MGATAGWIFINLNGIEAAPKIDMTNAPKPVDIVYKTKVLADTLCHPWGGSKNLYEKSAITEFFYHIAGSK